MWGLTAPRGFESRPFRHPPKVAVLPRWNRELAAKAFPHGLLPPRPSPAHLLSHPGGNMAHMHSGHGSHLEAPSQPCWHCTRFAGLLYQGTAAACGYPGGPRVRSQPAHGCAFWEREVGPPAGVRVLPPPVWHGKEGPPPATARGRWLRLGSAPTLRGPPARSVVSHRDSRKPLTREKSPAGKVDYHDIGACHDVWRALGARATLATEP